jgi:meso-butanediol dehydrogenase / (S,S)-butanediol dehydrogenase / diacetyl reductase
MSEARAPEKLRIGWIGLDKMGQPICERLNAHGIVVTPLRDGLGQDMLDKGVIKKKGGFIESFSASILLGYPSTPADLAGIAAFLASSDSDYVTGQVIMSDGGMILV